MTFREHRRTAIVLTWLVASVVAVQSEDRHAQAQPPARPQQTNPKLAGLPVDRGIELAPLQPRLAELQMPSSFGDDRLQERINKYGILLGEKNVDPAQYRATGAIIGWRACSTTFVGPEVMITAAHCTDEYGVMYKAPAIVRYTCKQVLDLDLAVCSGPAHRNPTESILTDSTHLKKDTLMTLVGWGRRTVGLLPEVVGTHMSAGVAQITDPPTEESARFTLGLGAFGGPGDSGGTAYLIDTGGSKARWLAGILIERDLQTQSTTAISLAHPKVRTELEAWSKSQSKAICGLTDRCTQ